MENSINQLVELFIEVFVSLHYLLFLYLHLSESVFLFFNILHFLDQKNDQEAHEDHCAEEQVDSHLALSCWLFTVEAYMERVALAIELLLASVRGAHHAPAPVLLETQKHVTL